MVGGQNPGFSAICFWCRLWCKNQIGAILYRFWVKKHMCMFITFRRFFLFLCTDHNSKRKSWKSSETKILAGCRILKIFRGIRNHPGTPCASSYSNSITKKLSSVVLLASANFRLMIRMKPGNNNQSSCRPLVLDWFYIQSVLQKAGLLSYFFLIQSPKLTMLVIQLTILKINFSNSFGY